MRYSGVRVWRGIAEASRLQHARCGVSIGLPTTLLCLAYESCADMHRLRRSGCAGGGRMLFVMELSASISAWCCWLARQEQKKKNLRVISFFILLTQNSALLDAIMHHARSCLCTSGRNSYAHIMYSNCDQKNIIAQLNGKDKRNLIYLIFRVGQWLVDTYRVGRLTLS